VTARDKLLVFLTRRDIEATNNVSERILRLSVIFRRVTNGFRSEWGAKVYADLAMATFLSRFNKWRARGSPPCRLSGTEHEAAAFHEQITKRRLRKDARLCLASHAASGADRDLRVPGLRTAFSLLHQVFPTEQEGRPLGLRWCMNSLGSRQPSWQVENEFVRMALRQVSSPEFRVSAVSANSMAASPRLSRLLHLGLYPLNRSGADAVRSCAPSKANLPVAACHGSTKTLVMVLTV
jgi:Transposase IS66 family